MPNIMRQDFDLACEAVWTELQYQDALPRRTEEDEAKDPASFATLGRRYLRKLEDNWADKPGEYVGDRNGKPTYAVPDNLHDLRKLAAIFVRGMVYCGIRRRSPAQAPDPTRSRINPMVETFER